MRTVWWVLIIALVGCDGDEGAGDADGGGIGCTTGDLVAQCPVGSNPVVGARADSACTGAMGGIALDGEGQATGQCLGVADCRVLCQFGVPCRCGVAEVSRDGVTCAPCDGAASCGNRMCEGGESPMNCPIDCGPACNAGERRCDGEALQECSLQGRWDDLACPSDEVCSAEDGPARCVRDVEIIGGMDAGVGEDADVLPEEGRVIDGDGAWPGLASTTTGQTPRDFVTSDHVIRLDDGSIHNRPTRFFQAQVEIAGNAGGNGRIRPAAIVQFQLAPDADHIEAFSVRGRFFAELDGTVLEPMVPFTADREAFCTAWAACNGPVEDCDATIATELETWGETRLQCIAELLASGADDACVQVFFGDACGWNPRHAWPDGVEFSGRDLVRRGDRILGRAVDQRVGVLVDLAAERAVRMAPAGDFVLRTETDRFDLSADGRIAAFTAQSGGDDVIIVWDVDADTRQAILPVSGGSTTALGLSPGGAVLALRRNGTGVATVDTTMSFWDVETETRLFSIRAIEGGSIDGRPTFSPDGRHFALVHRRPQQVEIWDLVDRVRTHILAFDAEAPADAVEFTPDGALLAVTWQGALTLWDVATGQRIYTRANTGMPRLDPDGQRGVSQGPANFRGEFTVLRAP